MIESIREWWGPLIGGAGMFASYVAGRERTRHRIAEVSSDLEAVQGEVKALRDLVSAQSIQLATIITNLEWIKANQESKR